MGSNPTSSAMTVSHEQAMQVALEQARLAAEHGDVPVGAVVVHNGVIIAARHNEREDTNDPTAHAEVLALRDAAQHLGRWRLGRAGGPGWRLLRAPVRPEHHDGEPEGHEGRDAADA